MAYTPGPLGYLPEHETLINETYQANLGRAPEAHELATYKQHLSHGMGEDVFRNLIYPDSTPSQTTGFNVPTEAVPSSQSGINWDTPMMQELLQSLTGEISGMRGNLDEAGELVDRRYRGLMKDALSPDMFQGTLNELNRKNMLNSSVASDTLSKVTSDVMNKIMGQSQDTQLQVAGEKAAIPERLANIATIGQESSSTDPLAPYELIARILMNQ